MTRKEEELTREFNERRAENPNIFLEEYAVKITVKDKIVHVLISSQLFGNKYGYFYFPEDSINGTGIYQLVTGYISNIFWLRRDSII